MDSECESTLMCDLNITGGLCTKACTMDGECTGKSGSVGACVSAVCFAPCDVAPDGGPLVDDAGKAKAPCKNKALECTDLPGKTIPICLPNPDAGPIDDAAAEAAAGDDGGLDAAAHD
jgi:hypothetical protein